MRSFMRLSVRRNVDLPQPDGPISAMTEHSGMMREISNSACVDPYQKFSPFTSNLFCTRGGTGCRPLRVRSEMMAEYDSVDTCPPRWRSPLHRREGNFSQAMCRFDEEHANSTSEPDA